MKIRIKDNSVRFRLTKSEVRAVSETGRVEAATLFDTGAFRYAVQLDANAAAMRAELDKQTITLFLPEKWGRDWFQNERVGFEETQTTKTGTELHLLLEKDFTCLDSRLEDQSDNYPNPKLQTNS